jgi:uncharacterized protein (TIGR03545 family)
MTKTPKKPKGPIRWNAILPFTIIVVLIAVYMHFFFDMHLRRAMEWAGYKALGVEVNIADVDTSFWNASLRIAGIEITDSEKPTHDIVKIGDVRFGMLWDALLRAKFVINEASVNQIEYLVPRKHPGKVAPPPPPSNEPSALAVQTDKVKSAALSAVQEKYADNVFGDLVGLLGAGGAQGQLDKLQETLPSKAMLDKFQKDLQDKQKTWDAKIKTLPQGPEIQALGDRLNKVKYKDFKSPQELQNSLQQLDGIFKDADAKFKTIQGMSGDLNKDLASLDSQYKEIQKQVQIDVGTLQKHFRLPQLDAKALTMAVFEKYLGPYKEKFAKYKALADKYLPPKVMKKKGASEQADTSIQPHVREKGITYEFGRQNSYPLFWVKHTAISSQAGLTPNSGNVKGEIFNITSNQTLIGKPTTALLTGDFPAMEVSGLYAKLSLDDTKENSIIDYDIKVASYTMAGKELVNTPDVQIAFNKAQGHFQLGGQVVGLKQVSLNLDNKFNSIDYAISSKNDIAQQILKAVFTGIPVVTLTVDGKGTLPDVPLSINSNLGPELQKGFEKQLQAKIDEAKKQVQAEIDKQIGQQKAQIDAQYNQLKNQVEGAVKKSQTQLEGQKKQAESKVDQAKKDSTDQVKKNIQKEGQKAIDDLKKQFGL